jgi:hypothetical protein
MIKFTITTIEKRTSQNSGKDYYILSDVEGVKYFTWDAAFATMGGKEVEVQDEKKGDSTWVKLPSAGGNKFGGGGGGGFKGRTPQEIRTTARTMCMSYAKDIALQTSGVRNEKGDMDLGYAKTIANALDAYKLMIKEVESGLFG